MDTNDLTTEEALLAGPLPRAYGKLPMGPTHQISVTAFDDFIQSRSDTATALSSTVLNDLLGRLDQLAIEVVADLANQEELSLSAQVFHSGDGQHWSQKAMFPEVPATQLSIDRPTVLQIGLVDGVIPTLAFARIAFVLRGSSGPVAAHVKCTVTCNDANEAAFARRVISYQEHHDDACIQMVRGGELVPESMTIESPDVMAFLDPFFASPKDQVGRWMVKPNDVGMGICIRADGSGQVIITSNDIDRIQKFLRTKTRHGLVGDVYVDYRRTRIGGNRDFRNRRSGDDGGG